MKCISSLISPVTLIVYVFFVLFEIFFVLISANCIIAHTAVCTGCFSYKSCMDKLHSGIVGIAHAGITSSKLCSLAKYAIGHFVNS